MQEPSRLDTISEVINKLKIDGYVVDFNLKNNCLECGGDYSKVFPGEFVVDKVFRFEGVSDPADEAIVYAISSEKHNIKGTLVNGYGVYSDEIADDMLEALEQKEK